MLYGPTVPSKNKKIAEYSNLIFLFFFVLRFKDITDSAKEGFFEINWFATEVYRRRGRIFYNLKVRRVVHPFNIFTLYISIFIVKEHSFIQNFHKQF